MHAVRDKELSSFRQQGYVFKTVRYLLICVWWGCVWVYTRNKFRNNCKRLSVCWDVERYTQRTALLP